MDDHKTFKLARPVQDIHGVKVTELKLRLPTAKEAFDLGLPFTPADDFDFPVLRAWLVRLSSQGVEVVDGLALSDLMAIAKWLGSLFRPTGDDLGNSDAPASL